MATKKYLSYDGLAEYDALIKAYAESAVSNKQDKLAGAEGQVIGFDADGNAVATEIESANRFFIMIDPSWFTMTNTPIWSMSSSQFESTGYTYLMSFDDETSEKTFNKYISEIHFDFSNGVYEFIFKESPDEHIAINVICIPLNDSYTSTFQLISGSSASDSTVNTSITIPAGRLLGDVNGDGIININDLNLINTAGAASDGGTYFGATVSEHVDSNGNILIDYLAADVDESGSITMMDTSKFLTYDNGDSLYLVSKDLLGNWSMVEGADASTEYPFYVDIQFEYADNHHDFIIIADNACSYISSQLQIVSGAIRIFARWLPVNDINAKVIVYNGNGNVNFVITPNAVTETINAVTETINASIDSVDTGSVFTQLVKPADVPESCVIDIEDMFFQVNGYTYLLYLIDAASENTYKKYVSKTTLASNKLTINFSDIPDSNIKMHFTRINVGSDTSRIAPVYTNNAIISDTITIPAGRMRGDVNGDGLVDEADIQMISSGTGSTGVKYWGATASDFADGIIPIDYQAADANGDGYINMDEILAISNMMSSYDNFSTAIDLLGNWSISTNNTDYLYYYDIDLTISSDKSCIVIIDGDAGRWISSTGDIVGTNKLRLYSKYPPINETAANVYTVDGNGSVDVIHSSASLFNQIDNKADKPLRITVTYNRNGYKSDTSYEQIQIAVKNHRECLLIDESNCVIAKLSNNFIAEYDSSSQEIFYEVDWGNGYFVFTGSFSNTNYTYTFDPSGNLTVDFNNIVVPVTTEDNGKFMRVVDGAWAAVAVPSAEEASF